MKRFQEMIDVRQQVKNLKIVVDLYKKIETKNIEMNIITKAKIVFLFC